jgi:hypothetical protein
MTHPGKAALHRLALRRTEKVGDTGVTLGSILEYVASLETEIELLRAAPQERQPYDLRLQIGRALDRLVCDESTPEQVDTFIGTFASFGLRVSDALCAEPVGFADPVDVRATGRAFDVRRSPNGRFTTAIYLADSPTTGDGGGNAED